ncbi:MAG: RNB domain-containing ribonuclease [Burkholderiales bacterium]|nr:RNB domain-containing ribonuclease [Burkholderiales bacterium]
MHPSRPGRRADLLRIAVEAMVERGLEPEYPRAALDQLGAIQAAADDHRLDDLRDLPWCSIDNDDSRDLDQLAVAEPLTQGAVRVRVAIADVDALVPRGCPIDDHAQWNTTSVYTSARIFPMLPERLSTDLTSLNPGQDRLALVTEMVIAADGAITESNVRRARVHNQAQLAYDAVSAWIEGQGPLPAAAQAAPGIEQQLRLQDGVAQCRRQRRRRRGSLEFETFQPRAQFDGNRVVAINQQPQNRARQLIEELMIATNTCTARWLAARGGASLRRVVRSPERWQRIVEFARGFGTRLPASPDGRALEHFLAERHRTDPLRFPDLSLVVIKLMGAGEYVVEAPGAEAIGHFGLAERDYTHSTAPNRRYPDLVTLRAIKALLAGAPPPYGRGELEALALHCTQQEDAARKVERRLRKSEAALFLQSRIGQRFDGIVTGRGDSGTWVRIFDPPAEGLLVGRAPALDVGRTLRVELRSTDVERGFIDFAYVHK